MARPLLGILVIYSMTTGLDQMVSEALQSSNIPESQQLIAEGDGNPISAGKTGSNCNLCSQLIRELDGIVMLGIP